MATIPVPIEQLAQRLNIEAIRKITGKVEKKEVKDFKIDNKTLLESIRTRRKPMNASITKMPIAFYENMMPSLSEEREPPQDKFETMRLINERLSNKTYPTSEPINNYNGNGNGKQQQSLPISEERIRELIREEIYNVLEKIVKKENENRLNEETIQIRVGESLFSGKLTPLIKLNKK